MAGGLPHLIIKHWLSATPICQIKLGVIHVVNYITRDDLGCKYDQKAQLKLA